LTCDATRLALQIRSLKTIHIYSVPILPLGFWRDWHCQACDEDSHRKPGTRKSRRWAAIFFIAMIAGVAWLDTEETGMPIWALRIAATLTAIALAFLTIRNAPDAHLKAQLERVIPADEKVCGLCRGILIQGERWRCSQCGVERVALRA